MPPTSEATSLIARSCHCLPRSLTGKLRTEARVVRAAALGCRLLAAGLRSAVSAAKVMPATIRLVAVMPSARISCYPKSDPHKGGRN